MAAIIELRTIVLNKGQRQPKEKVYSLFSLYPLFRCVKLTNNVKSRIKNLKVQVCDANDVH